MIPRKTVTYLTIRPMANVYQFPEEFYLDENKALYCRARNLCRLYKLPYAEARKKHFEEQNRMYPEGEK